MNSSGVSLMHVAVSVVGVFFKLPCSLCPSLFDVFQGDYKVY